MTKSRIIFNGNVFNGFIVGEQYCKFRALQRRNNVLIWLLTASLIWGFSFGLIKGLTTGLDPFVLGLIRALIAATVFLPWQIAGQRRGLPKKVLVLSMICGFIQIGLMYGPYQLAFRYLKSHEVALLTMTTPIIMASLLALFTRINLLRLGAAVLTATAGGMVVAWKDLGSAELQTGVLLVQLSNLLFAIGLLLWKKWLTPHADQQLQLMFPYFIGAAVAAGILAVVFGQDWRAYTPREWGLFLWLGGVASGLGFYFWNRGALQVSPQRLAVANNIKLPMAVLISILVFGESVEWSRLIIGISLLIFALGLQSSAVVAPANST